MGEEGVEPRRRASHALDVDAAEVGLAAVVTAGRDVPEGAEGRDAADEDEEEEEPATATAWAAAATAWRQGTAWRRRLPLTTQRFHCGIPHWQRLKGNHSCERLPRFRQG